MSGPAVPSPESGGPLAGYRVIDVTANVLGPVATQILGDMGADVIKVEPPEGDYTRHIGPSRNPGMGTLFLSTNRNKRSVVLDLKRTEAREALIELARTADVFVHSMRPGAAERLGIDYASLRAINPRLVHGSASGFRLDSDRRDWPAFDDIIQGASGIAAMMARVFGEPLYFPTVIVDKLCGYILGSSIAMALLWRERTGRGQEVHVPMMDSMVGFNLTEHFWGGVLDEPSLGLGYSRMFTRHRRPYATSDGHLCVMATTDRQWHRLFDAIGRPELKAEPRFSDATQRSIHIDELYRTVSDAIAHAPTAEWRARLDAADIPNGPANDFEDLLDDPYLATGFFQRCTHPSEGRYVTTSVPVHFSDCPGAIRRMPPRLGEHTGEVLGEIGLATSPSGAQSA